MSFTRARPIVSTSASLTVQPTMFNQEEKTCDLFTGSETIAVSWYANFFLKKKSASMLTPYKNYTTFDQKYSICHSHTNIFYDLRKKFLTAVKEQKRTWKTVQMLYNMQLNLVSAFQTLPHEMSDDFMFASFLSKLLRTTHSVVLVPMKNREKVYSTFSSSKTLSTKSV